MGEERDIAGRIEGRAERLHIPIGAICNNNCIFCMEEDREGRYVNNSAMTPERVRWVLEQHQGYEEVCFTSGEPTTRDDFPTFVGWAKELGYRLISVMSNGRRMSHLPYTAALAKRGLNRVYISIHGHEKALHEGLTRTPGSFEQTVGGLKSAARLKAYGVELHTSTVLTKRNLPHMAEIYGFLRGLGVDQVVFNVMQANGRAHTYFEQLFASYTETAAEFRRCLDTVDEASPMAFLVDIPLCTTENLPDFNRGYVEKYRHYDLDSRVELPVEGKQERRGSDAGKKLLMVMRSDLDDAERAKRPECGACRYDAQCEGVWKNYLSRFGWDEFQPVTQAAAE
ncbi:MAG TPA: radical SAM protein HxsC4 [Polyangiaceae bacterium]|nr:radical SAM protein HxsC4 [Polyangiaceae bacterium]